MGRSQGASEVNRIFAQAVYVIGSSASVRFGRNPRSWLTPRYSGQFAPTRVERRAEPSPKGRAEPCHASAPTTVEGKTDQLKKMTFIVEAEHLQDYGAAVWADLMPPSARLPTYAPMTRTASLFRA